MREAITIEDLRKADRWVRRFRRLFPRVDYIAEAQARLEAVQVNPTHEGRCCRDQSADPTLRDGRPHRD